MPFYKLDSYEPPNVLLKQATTRLFQLLEGFRWQKPDGSFYIVKAHDPNLPPTDGNSTDLASVPAWLWWFVASYGHHTLPALLHDQAVDDKDLVPDRNVADTWFRESMKDAGVFWLRRWIMWAAVSIETLRQTRRLRFWLFIAHVLALVATIVLAAFGVDPWWAPVAVALAGLVWGPRRWTAVLVGGSLIAAPSVLVLAVWGLEYAFNGLQALVTGSWPPPGPAPTYRRLTAGQKPPDEG